MGQHDKAVADFTEPIRLNSEWDWYFHLRADAWLEKKEFGKAIADFTEAIKLDPMDVRLRAVRAHTWSDLGNHAKAIVDLDEAIRLVPGNPDFYISRGFERLRDHQPEEKALADFNRAIDLKSREPAAYIGRGFALNLAGQYGEVVGNFNEMIRVLPTDPSGHQRLA